MGVNNLSTLKEIEPQTAARLTFKISEKKWKNCAQAEKI